MCSSCNARHASSCLSASQCLTLCCLLVSVSLCLPLPTHPTHPPPSTRSDLHIYRFCDYSIHFVALLLYITAMCSLALFFTSFIQRPLILNIVGFLLFFAAMICNAFFGNVFANIIYRPDLPNVLQIIFWIFPWCAPRQEQGAHASE